MLMYFFILLLVFVLGIVFLASRKPDSFRIQRSTMIHAPAEKIFALIIDLHEHEAWSPWEKADPHLKRSYGGAASGVGAVYEWEGNSEVGKGRIEIIESIPHELVRLKIDFIKPFEAHNQVDYTLESNGHVVTLTQAMYGPSPLVSKIMGLVFNMDKMVGTKFAEGLNNIKLIAEK